MGQAEAEDGSMTEKDAFDLWWEWAEKPLDSQLTIDAEIHDAVMALPPDEWRDRAKANEAVRDGLKAWPAASRRECGLIRRSQGDGVIYRSALNENACCE